MGLVFFAAVFGLVFFVAGFAWACAAVIVLVLLAMAAEEWG